MTGSGSLRIGMFFVLSSLMLGNAVSAGDTTNVTVRLGGVSVIGTQEAMKKIPGSGAIVDENKLTSSKPLSVGEALRGVSGVYVRDEDGMGLRPNISIRGIDGHRSVKLLFLEDGLPISLAPYGENSAYYAPLIDRAARIEVLKGSGSILYGPQTVAGVINYITKNPPEKETLTTTLSGGSSGYLNLQADYGTSFENGGVLVQGLHKRGDGFRADTPFSIYDFRTKAVMALASDQELVLRAQYFSENSKISYVGLTQAMYDKNPNQNPAIHDFLYVERLGLSATHSHYSFFGGQLDTSFYGYVTKRDFWRQNFDRDDKGASYERISGNGSNFDSIFWKKSNNGNNRSYKVVGVEPRFESGEFKVGSKIHYEFEDNKRIAGSSGDARTGTIAADERRDTFATALYAQNRYPISDAWDVTVGLRLESYRQGRDILKADNAQTVSGYTQTVLEWIPGLGTTYVFSPETTVFAGVHRGFAPPKFADALVNTASAIVDQKLDSERSWNYEVGVRQTLGGTVANLTGFFYDYQNQIINAAASSGFDKANAGKTQVLGIEADVMKEWALATDMTVYGAAVATYVDATQKQGVYSGKKLPYSPALTGSWRLGLRNGGWDSALEMVYVGDMFSDDANTVAGSANGEIGEIKSHIVWNLSGRYTLDTMSFFATAKNIFDTAYIASRRPNGIFPGTSRQVQVGLTVTL